MSGPGRLIIHYHSEGLIRDLSAKAQQFRIETLRMGDAKSSAQSAPSGRASAGKTYVILGDGEINAGVVWEGVMAAARAAVTLKK